MNKTKEWHKDISNSEVAQIIKKELDEMPKESWEEAIKEFREKFGRFYIEIDKTVDIEWSDNGCIASDEIEQFIKERESKYLKVLREIVGEEKYPKVDQNAEGVTIRMIEANADYVFGYNIKRQEILNIIKNNNIEL